MIHVCAVQVYDGCGVGVHVCVCARGGLQHLFLLMTFTLLSHGLLMNPNSLTAARLAPGSAQSLLP